MTPLSESPHARARQRLDERGRPRADDRLSALTLPSEHFAAIERSHARCAALGLSRIESPDLRPDLGAPTLPSCASATCGCYTHAAPVMELLFEQIINTQNMVVLTDRAGTIIHSIGDDDFLERASKVALQPGVNWSEAAQGHQRAWARR